MTLTGGCYCGGVRYEADEPLRMRGLCLCRTCQKISGGAGNLFFGIEGAAFRYTKGEPKSFKRPEVPDAPTREFCGTCGVHLAARSPKAPGGLIVKVGTLDDPSLFGGPEFAVWTEDMQSFHLLPQGMKTFARLPGR